ncbi:MAG: zinc ribbon domain-containing protein [Clostridiales bacterium]|nr:zinc ribbon domain-containing protein [Clostridiales bacterium]
MRCQRCGAKIQNGFRFCPKCGALITTDSDSAAPLAPGKMVSQDTTRTGFRHTGNVAAAGSGKRPHILKRALLCAVSVLVVVTAGYVGYHRYIANRKIASIPDPEVFFGVSADIDKMDSWNKKRITYTFEFDEDASTAVQAYTELLASSDYLFYLSRETSYNGILKYYCVYRGGKRYLDQWDCDILITDYGDDYYSDSNIYVVKIHIYNYRNFELTSAEFYDWDANSVQSDASQGQTDTDADAAANQSSSSSDANDSGDQPDASQGQTDANASTDKSSGSSGTNSSGSASTEKILVAEELSSGSAAKPASDAMDLLYYAQQEMTLGEKSTSGTSIVRSFKGSASDYDVLSAYVELLCEEYEFELVADPYYNDSGKTYTFIEFVLHYTGSKSMTGDGIVGTFTGNTGDIMIYATVERDTLKGAIWCDSTLDLGNDGYVYGSSSGGASYIGDSFTTGLYLLADGSYQTMDGRLTAAVGEAMLIADGTATTFPSEFIYDNDDNRQEIYVNNNYGTEQQVIYIPTTVTLASGQIYDSSYFIIESDSATKNRGVYSTVPPFTWTAMFACLHDGEYICPVRGLSGVMTEINVRVMYVDESVAVFYTCAQFESEPYEVESLIAVEIGTDTVVENQPDGEYTISVGDSVDITGPSEFDTGYNLWDWEFVYGEAYAILTGTNAQTCKVIGTSVGEVRVKVTYSYSLKEPDVLTGIERSVGHSATREYVITIEK